MARRVGGVRPRWYTGRVFPTTIWTRIGEAGAEDESALEDFAVRYRPAVLEFIQRRGFSGNAADDLCQDVFLRVLRGGVLAKADPGRGRFRSLLATITMHVLHDHLRKRREVPSLLPDVAAAPEDFDHAWALNLTARALDQLREQGSPYFDVLTAHLAGNKPSRNRLWIARRKLAALIRQEIAKTCATPADAEEELAHLRPYLRPPSQERPT